MGSVLKVAFLKKYCEKDENKICHFSNNKMARTRSQRAKLGHKAPTRAKLEHKAPTRAKLEHKAPTRAKLERKAPTRSSRAKAHTSPQTSWRSASFIKFTDTHMPVTEETTATSILNDVRQRTELVKLICAHKKSTPKVCNLEALTARDALQRRIVGVFRFHDHPKFKRTNGYIEMKSPNSSQNEVMIFESESNVSIIQTADNSGDRTFLTSEEIGVPLDKVESILLELGIHKNK
jgi:hypothetical protein